MALRSLVNQPLCGFNTRNIGQTCPIRNNYSSAQGLIMMIGSHAVRSVLTNAYTAYLHTKGDKTNSVSISNDLKKVIRKVQKTLCNLPWQECGKLISFPTIHVLIADFLLGLSFGFCR